MEAAIVVAQDNEDPGEFVKRASRERVDFALAKRNEIVTVIYCISTKAIILANRKHPTYLKKLESEVYRYAYIQVKKIQSTREWLEESFKDFTV